jgi:hypothetical protein
VPGSAAGQTCVSRVTLRREQHSSVQARRPCAHSSPRTRKFPPGARLTATIGVGKPAIPGLFPLLLAPRASDRIDSRTAVQHPRYVVTSSRRLAAMLGVLTLWIGNPGVCAGWRATPEARMACCDEGPVCPMHGSELHTSDSTHAGTQEQADSCCAGSERNDWATAASTFVLSGSLALDAGPLPVVVPMLAPHSGAGRAVVPLAPSRVPKHLLLSVFLV